MVAYASRNVRGAEANYAPTHLEALGVVWAINKFRHFLAGRHFLLRTDHAALKYIFNNDKPSAKVQRWAAALFEYDFETQHQPGKQNPADALSRLL